MKKKYIKKHYCSFDLINNDNNNIYWLCKECGYISNLEPYKDWALLGGLDPNWSPFFDIALKQKIDDMNNWNYFDFCKNVKPCNCISCLSIWTKESFGIN